ncbi:hypothetical protein T09_89 [Trichinella sp. T9]|nr:hypothetical protein T09_89 [Trichinella sp. T9]
MQALLLAMIQMLPPGELVEYWLNFIVKASISFLSSTLPSSLISTLYSFLYINKSGICIDLLLAIVFLSELEESLKVFSLKLTARVHHEEIVK